ncbi:MAG: hypothetical protein HYY58_03130 [Candidatus Omnitrophica bacterium]|nr:hypothetical protein [Candidatus Omnitrophota bacterium]
MKLWIVLDERPGDAKEGYLVIFHPQDKRFGLATKPAGADAGVLLGLHGNFIQTVNSL